MNNTDSLLYNYLDELGYDVMEIVHIKKDKYIDVFFVDNIYGTIHEIVEKEDFKKYLDRI